MMKKTSFCLWLMALTSYCSADVDYLQADSSVKCHTLETTSHLVTKLRPSCSNIGDGEIMQSFLIKSSGPRFVRYAYKCCTPDKAHVIHQNIILHTGWHTYKNIVYLQYHRVQCMNKQFLMGFHMETRKRSPGNYEVRYTYKCFVPSVQVRRRTTCSTRYTNYVWATEGKQRGTALRYHNVDCGVGMFLNGFILQRNAQLTFVRYQYWCCHVKH